MTAKADEDWRQQQFHGGQGLKQRVGRPPALHAAMRANPPTRGTELLAVHAGARDQPRPHGGHVRAQDRDEPDRRFSSATGGPPESIFVSPREDRIAVSWS